MEGFKRYCTAALTALALLLIRGYQRWLSPYKGYSCAYRLHVGGSEGCSGYGLKVIQRYGLVTGYKLLQRRLWRCGQVAALHREQRLPTPRVMRRRRATVISVAAIWADQVLMAATVLDCRMTVTAVMCLSFSLSCGRSPKTRKSPNVNGASWPKPKLGTVICRTWIVI